MKKFLSDNNAPTHPAIMDALVAANHSDADSYGADTLTKEATEKIQNLFDSTPDVYFVTIGTAANVIALAGLLKPYEAVLCVKEAHINTDECGAFERLTGNKIIAIDGIDGKLTPELVQPYLNHQGNTHRVQIRALSISNVTETGTVYSIEDVRALADFCHEHDLYLHMDGARLANACDALGVSVKELTDGAGVDILSLGGTKNGLMIGEAVVVFDHAKSESFAFIRKQFMQLVSKHRYLSAQFLAYLTDDLYLTNAHNANAQTTRMKEALENLGFKICNGHSYANVLFVELSQGQYDCLKQKYPLYYQGGQLRIVMSFDTTEDDVNQFIAAIKDVENI